MRLQYQRVKIAAKAAVVERTVVREPGLWSARICWIRLLIALPALVLLAIALLELAIVCESDRAARLNETKRKEL